MVVTFKSAPCASWGSVYGMYVELSFVCEQENVSVQSQLFICFLLSFLYCYTQPFFISRIVFENVHSMFSSQVETQIVLTRIKKSAKKYFSLSQREKNITKQFCLAKYKICYSYFIPFIRYIFLSAHWNVRWANNKNVCFRLREQSTHKYLLAGHSVKSAIIKCWLDKNAAGKQSERYIAACGERSAHEKIVGRYVGQQKFHLGIKMHHYVVMCGVCQ
jgi:hypothetical protein